MGAPSLWRFSLNYTATATTTTTASSHSSLIYPLYTKRRCILPYSSYSNINSSLSSKNERKRLPKKEELGKITISVDSEINQLYNSSNSDTCSNNNSGFSFETFFGKQASWRKILITSRKVRSIILLNAITVVYASNIPVVKQVEAIIDPEAFTVVRFAMAAIPFIPFVFQARGDAQTRNAGMELGFWISLGYILQAVGLQTSDAGRASFMAMFTVIVVPLFDGMLGSKIPVRTWFGALMSLTGVAMLESSGSPPCIGDLLNFLSAVSFGIHMLRTEHISRSTKGKNFIPLLGYEICVVSLLSTCWYFIEGWFGGSIRELNQSSWTLATIMEFPWIPALYTGIFSTGLCLSVEMASMRDVSATETALIYGLEPVWGAGFAWFLLGERWGVSGWIGAALVLGGSLTVQIMGARANTNSNEFSISDKQSSFSASPIVVKARKLPSDLIKK